MATVSDVEMSVALSLMQTRTRWRCCVQEADVVVVTPTGKMPRLMAMVEGMVERSAPVSMMTPPMGEKGAETEQSGFRYETMSIGRFVDCEMNGVGTEGIGLVANVMWDRDGAWRVKSLL